MVLTGVSAEAGLAEAVLESNFNTSPVVLASVVLAFHPLAHDLPEISVQVNWKTVEKPAIYRPNRIDVHCSMKMSDFLKVCTIDTKVRNTIPTLREYWEIRYTFYLLECVVF